MKPVIQWVKFSNVPTLQTLGQDAFLVAEGSWILVFQSAPPYKNFIHFVDEGVQVVAGHRSLPCLAYAEKAKNPRIFIITYPDFKVVRTLPGAVEAKYLSLDFSDMELLVALLRSVGHTEVVVWNWRTEEKVCAFSSESQEPHHNIRVSLFSPVRVAQWDRENLSVWQVHCCYKKTMISNVNVELTVKTPLSGAWNTDGDLLIVDSNGTLYSTNLELGVLKKECDFPNPKIYPEECPSPSYLALHSAGVIIYVDGQVALLKQKAERWSPTWICSTPKLSSIVCCISANKEICFGWTVDNQLVSFKGVKSSEINLIQTYGNGFDIVCVIQHPGDQFLGHAASTREISLWDLKTGTRVQGSEFVVDDTLLTMVAAPNHEFALLGYFSGFVEILWVPSMSRKRFHPTRNPIDTVRFSNSGATFCVSSRKIGEFFVVKIASETSNSMELVASLQADCYVVDYFLNEKILLVLVASSQTENCGSRKIISYILDPENRKFIQEKVASLSESYIQINFEQKSGKCLAIPRSSTKFHLLDLDFTVDRCISSGHLLSGFYIKSMRDLMITYGLDGLVIFHESVLEIESDFQEVPNEDTIVTHHRADGGVSFVDSNGKGSVLLVSGQNGCLVCYATGFPSDEEVTSREKYLVEIIDLDSSLWSEPDETLLEKWEKERIAKLRAENMEVKKTILKRLSRVKQKLKQLIDDNETCPEDEKLSLAEFELDVIGREAIVEDEQLKRQETYELECAHIHDLKACAQRIIEYTWSTVETQSRELRPILTSATDSGVHSYALLPSSKIAAHDANEWLQERMRIVRDFHAGDFFKPWIPRSDRDLKAHLMESNHALTTTRRDSLIADLTHSAVVHQQDLPGNPTTSHLFLPERDIPHSLLQVHTQHQAKHIIFTTEKAIRELMEYFNKEFSVVANEKEREFRSLAERRARLRFVASELRDLGASSDLSPEEVAEPRWAPTEVPETLLTVKDDELQASPYLSPEEIEHQRQIAEEDENRRKLELADDFRKRALGVMMDGVLEKTWQDEIKKDIPKPLFMEGKRPEEWTEEESRIAKTYNESVEKLLTERDRYNKYLAAEFKQLSASTQESGARFDEKLKKLSELKLRVESAVGQEQLSILRMRLEILNRVQMNRKEEEIKSAICKEENVLENLQDQAAKLHELITESRTAQETWISRDKNLEKNFKKEFLEYSPIIGEQMHKLFKKRPSLQGRALSNPALLNELGRYILLINERNRRLPVPSECLDFLKAIDILDGPFYIPANVSENSWENLCRLRRAKIDSELKVRALAIEVSQTEQTAMFWQKKIKASKDLIYKKQNELEIVQTEKTKAELDCSVQLVLPQRVVEVPTTGKLSDFNGASLLSRSVVDQVNLAIQRVGQQKIRAIQKACNFRKGVVYKEWEHQKLKLRVEDLRARLDTLEHIHVTKELQDILNSRARGVYDEKGFAHLEREIRAVNLRFEKAELALIESIEANDKKIREIEDQNEELDRKIVTLNKTLGQKLVLRDVAGEQQEAKLAKLRMKIILRRGRLITRAQELENEIASLQTERDLLSLKAHPTLIQKE